MVEWRAHEGWILLTIPTQIYCINGIWDDFWTGSSRAQQYQYLKSFVRFKGTSTENEFIPMDPVSELLNKRRAARSGRREEGRSVHCVILCVIYSLDRKPSLTRRSFLRFYTILRITLEGRRTLEMVDGSGWVVWSVGGPPSLHLNLPPKINIMLLVAVFLLRS